jgi:hypothetical protein
MESLKNQSMEHSRVSEASSQTIPTVDESLSLPIDELLSRLGTSLSGLSSDEVERRLKRFTDIMSLPRKRRREPIVEFLLHFRSPLGDYPY